PSTGIGSAGMLRAVARSPAATELDSGGLAGAAGGCDSAACCEYIIACCSGDILPHVAGLPGLTLERPLACPSLPASEILRSAGGATGGGGGATPALAAAPCAVSEVADTG